MSAWHVGSGVPADRGAEVIGGVEVVRDAAVVQHDIAAHTVAASHLQPVDSRFEFQQVEDQAGCGAEDETVHHLTPMMPAPEAGRA